MEDLMSVLRFILFSFFLHIHKYIVRVLLDRFLSLSPFVSLSYKLTSQGKLKQISWSRERTRVLPLSEIQILSTRTIALTQPSWAQLTLIVFYIDRRLFLSSSNTDGSSSRRFS